MNEFNSVYEADFHPGGVALVSEAKPRFCAAIKGEGQEPVTVSNKGAKL